MKGVDCNEEGNVYSNEKSEIEAGKLYEQV
jgi:hypothetical protein